jgi:hypothetical protein
MQSVLPDLLRSGASLKPQYVHPSVKCSQCADGWMHVEYTHDERLLVCDGCAYFDVVNAVGRFGLRNA